MKYFLCKQGSCYSGIVDYQLNLLYRIAGLQASAGVVIFSESSTDKGAVFVDGRYTLAANISVDKTKFDIEDFRLNSIIEWIKNNIKIDNIIAVDRNCFSLGELNYFRKMLSDYKIELFDSYEYFGLKHEAKNVKLYDLNNSKMDQCIEWLKSTDLDAYLFCDPCLVSWLLGIRDLNNDFTKSILAYLLITKSGNVILYSQNTYCNILNIQVKSINYLNDFLSTLEKIGCNLNEVPAFIDDKNLLNVECPIDQSIKTQTEIEDIKIATEYDSIAIIKFLNWFYSCTDEITELDVVAKLDEFRQENPNYIGNSFATIAAADSHAAIVHYEPTKVSNTLIKNILLLDSGGQYKNGTTDITRTISRSMPTEYERKIYTLVLKGHIALASAIFPRGTTCAQLDTFARQFLWKNNLDYQHGTGHGIGYLLNVHEGKYGFSRRYNYPIKSNILMSNEPGYYEENHFGVRLENMMLSKNINDDFFCFETISLISFDDKFIDKTLLTSEEKNWLDEYNGKIEKLCNKFNIKMQWR